MLNTYRVKIPDRHYWKENIPCQSACPVLTDARGYVRAIARGDDELAYLIARGPNPLASLCGWVCGAPCEINCRRGKLDAPVAIRSLKRFVCEKYRDKVLSSGKKVSEYLQKAIACHPKVVCNDREDLLSCLQAMTKKRIKKISDKKVAVIGAGPAGLAASHDLALLGYQVTLYEAEKELAGMLAFGVPSYRLPREVIREEVQMILDLGVKAITGCVVGKDVEFGKITAENDAVVIAVGAKKSRRLAIPGIEGKGVLGGVEFLQDVFLDRSTFVGNKIVVIGGGSVAYDVGRTALRFGFLDAARTALRMSGVQKVHLCCLESLDEMPADHVEITEGEEEGIERHNRWGPRSIELDEEGKAKAVLFVKCMQVFDKNGKFDPIFDEKQTLRLECDTVLVAIGQSFDLSFLDPESSGLEMTQRGVIKCDPSGATANPKIFVAGDLAHGPKLMIHAIASGKAAARRLHEEISGEKIDYDSLDLHFPIAEYQRENDYEKQERIPLQNEDAQVRKHSLKTVVDKGYGCSQARAEAGRCFDCAVNTIFDGEKCILCGGCVDVCPQLCLKLVSTGTVCGDDDFDPFLKEYLGNLPVSDASAIIKDETICIRCGLCAERCPTGAITMERYIFEEKPLCRTKQNPEN